MKPNIKHVLLTLLGLSIGFVVTFEAAAGPTVTVPGNICQARQGDTVKFGINGDIEGNNQIGKSRVFCPLAHNSEVEKVDVDIHFSKRSNAEDTLRCTLRIRDRNGDSFETNRNRRTAPGNNLTFTNNRRVVPADGFFFVDCFLPNNDEIEFITVEDQS